MPEDLTGKKKTENQDEDVGNASQMIHGSRRDLDREYGQVVRYSLRKVYTAIKTDNQRRRGIRTKVIWF